MPNLKTDKQLTTAAELLDRIASIARQRDELCETPARSENHTQFARRQARIAKLTEREDALRMRLRKAA